MRTYTFVVYQDETSRRTATLRIAARSKAAARELFHESGANAGTLSDISTFQPVNREWWELADGSERE